MSDGNQKVYSEIGLALTQQFEGLRLSAYQDAGGVWTIGYGHTGADVHAGMTISREQACELLRRDIGRAVETVNRLVKATLTQNQFDGLVDFVFNVGAGNFASSSLLRRLNAGDWAGATAEFAKWERCGDVVVKGLRRRREAEAELFRAA